MAAYDPRMMVRVLIYGYSHGVASSRRIERATYEDVAFRYLAAAQHPDHDTIATFRKEQLENRFLHRQIYVTPGHSGSRALQVRIMETQ